MNEQEKIEQLILDVAALKGERWLIRVLIWANGLMAGIAATMIAAAVMASR